MEHAAALTQQIAGGAQGELLLWLEAPCSLTPEGANLLLS